MVLIDPPFYQLWLSVVQKLTLGEPRLVSAYAAIMSVATPFSWYLFLREYLRSRTLALAGWAILAWLPSWIAIFGYTMTETLFLPLLGLSLWQTMRAKRMRTVRSFCGMVALFTLTGLTRATSLPLAGVSGFFVWIRHPQRLRTLGWSVLIVAGLMGPTAIRNYCFMNLWSPFGSGYQAGIYATSGRKDIAIELTRDGSHWGYSFGSPSLYTPQLAPLSQWAPKRDGRVSIAIDLRHGTADWEREWRRTTMRGGDLWRLRWENVVIVMLGPSWPDDDPGETVAVVANAIRWIWAPLFVTVLCLCLAFRRAVLRQPIVPALICTWFIFQAATLVAVNEGRYRKPLEGLLVVQTLALVEFFMYRPRYARA